MRETVHVPTTQDQCPSAEKTEPDSECPRARGGTRQHALLRARAACLGRGRHGLRTGSRVAGGRQLSE